MIAGLSRSITPNQEIVNIKHYPDKFVGLGGTDLFKNEEYVRTKPKEVASLGLKALKLHPIGFL